MLTLGLENGSGKTTIVVGLRSITRRGDAPVHTGEPIGGPLSIGDWVCTCVTVCGVVHAGLRVLSLLVKEGRFIFGVVVGF